MSTPAGPAGWLRRRPGGSGDGYRREDWSLLGSEGDEVSVEASLPTVEPRGVAVVAHGATTSREAPHVRAAARALARAGIAALAPDAPHHGARRTGPMDEEVLRSAPFFRRAVGDLMRVAALAGETAGLAGLPLGYVGFSMGALTGVSLLARHPDVVAAVLVVGGAISPAVPGEGGGVDLLAEAASVTDADVLMLQADADEVFDRASAFALYDALGCPKQIVFFPGTHAVWSDPAERYRAIVGHLRSRLAVT